MLIAGADSGSALLDGNYRPIKIIATVAIIGEPPYRKPSSDLHKIIEREPHDVTIIKEEIECIMRLLSRCKKPINIAHIDISAGSIDLSEIELEDIDVLDIPRGVKSYLKNLFPIIQPLLKSLKDEYGVSPIGIGKESTIVRLAELGTAVYAILYGLERVRKFKRMRIGLPRATSINMSKRYIRAVSLLPGEHDLEYELKIDPKLIEGIEIEEYPNPIARGFRVIELRA